MGRELPPQWRCRWHKLDPEPVLGQLVSAARPGRRGGAYGIVMIKPHVKWVLLQEGRGANLGPGLRC